jgi:hypothetical protein
LKLHKSWRLLLDTLLSENFIQHLLLKKSLFIYFYLLSVNIARLTCKDFHLVIVCWFFGWEKNVDNGVGLRRFVKFPSHNVCTEIYTFPNGIEVTCWDSRFCGSPILRQKKVFMRISRSFWFQRTTTWCVWHPSALTSQEVNLCRRYKFINIVVVRCRIDERL